jgi:excisionase family DNA binding protein
MTIEIGQMLTVKEVSQLLKISKSLLYLKIQRKEIPYVRLSTRRMVIRLSDLQNWIEKKAVVEKT